MFSETSPRTPITVAESDRIALNEYLKSVHFSPNSDNIYVSTADLIRDCFTQHHIFLADSHTLAEWYPFFQAYCYELMYRRYQPSTDADFIMRSLGFVKFATTIMGTIREESPASVARAVPVMIRN